MSAPTSRTWSRSWWSLCALHAGASVLLWWIGQDSASALVWHARDWVQHPWTLWTSAWVHLGLGHLVGNVLALGAVAAAGGVLRADARCTVAWLLAWPLTQVSLLLWPTVDYAVGLSGLLHAGVLLLAVPLVWGPAPVRVPRLWGGVLLVGALTKVALEHGWSQPLMPPADAGMTVVQAAHTTGAFWGLVLGLGVVAWQRHARRREGAKKPAEAGL
ncbi:rhomboid family intramembrane serine protease [Hydrogenophaga sp. BPS33]|uniref:rhomboid family intramembrane serine protease n=1 Tax=Hydrogenophaga sp. BPS33 TaxID=2651974 RepID=UPI00135909F7|nr:rhomboid family intramembrane serine protease [Hydrogenophaga sp. BPS33]